MDVAAYSLGLLASVVGLVLIRRHGLDLRQHQMLQGGPAPEAEQALESIDYARASDALWGRVGFTCALAGVALGIFALLWHLAFV